MTLTEEHFQKHQSVLKSKFGVGATAGHSISKGTPREFFVSEFLRAHIPEDLSIGMGEVIDARSKSGERRPQHDIVIYKSAYPKLDLGANISAFFVESVVAVIEVKSVLDKAGVQQAARASQYLKGLSPSHYETFRTSRVRMVPSSYIFSYGGPKSLATVVDWVRESYSDLSLSETRFGAFDRRRDQTAVALDGIFILDLGCFLCDNSPFRFRDRVYCQSKELERYYDWVRVVDENNVLLYLFSTLLALSLFQGQRMLDPTGYLSHMKERLVDYAERIG